MASLALMRKAVAQWLQFPSLDRLDERGWGGFGESAEAAAGSDALCGFAHAGTSPGSPGCRCLSLNRHVWFLAESEGVHTSRSPVATLAMPTQHGRANRSPPGEPSTAARGGVALCVHTQLLF